MNDESPMAFIAAAVLIMLAIIGVDQMIRIAIGTPKAHNHHMTLESGRIYVSCDGYKLKMFMDDKLIATSSSDNHTQHVYIKPAKDGWLDPQDESKD
jgi:hypothetical protein